MLVGCVRLFTVLTLLVRDVVSGPFAALITALARTAPNPGTLDSFSTVVPAISATVLNPFSIRIFAVLGPIPGILVIAVVIINPLANL